MIWVNNEQNSINWIITFCALQSSGYLDWGMQLLESLKSVLNWFVRFIVLSLSTHLFGRPLILWIWILVNLQDYYLDSPETMFSAKSMLFMSSFFSFSPVSFYLLASCTLLHLSLSPPLHPSLRHWPNIPQQVLLVINIIILTILFEMFKRFFIFRECWCTEFVSM